MEEGMKPLTDNSIAKGAIIEGYLWEVAKFEVENKNIIGVSCVLGLLREVINFFDNAIEPDKAKQALRSGLPHRERIMREDDGQIVSEISRYGGPSAGAPTAPPPGIDVNPTPEVPSAFTHA